MPHRPATLFIILQVTSGFGAVAVAAVLAAVLRRVRPLARLRLKRDAPPFVAALAAAFFVAVAVATIARHRAFATNGYDLGEYANFIYQFGRGHFFVQTILPSENFHPLSLTPLLALLAPATYVLAEPEYLLLLQAGALAAGVYLTFWAARAPGSSGWAAAALAASFALSPALHGAAFHAALPRTYALPLVVAAYGFFARGRFGPGVLCAALVALCREDLALHAIGLAVFGGFATGRRRAGVAVAAAFALYFVILGSVLYPRWTQPGSRPYYAVFADMKALAAGPGWLKAAFVAAKVGYLAVLCLPTVALWSRAGAAFITWVTPLAVPVLAMRPGIFAVGSQYPAAVLPFVYGAAAYALRRWPPPTAGVKSRSARYAVFVAVGSQLLLAAAWANVVVAPRLRECRGGDRARALAAAVKLVPPGAAVCADEHLAPHLCHRRYCYVWPEAAGYRLPAAPNALLVERPPAASPDAGAIVPAARAWGLNLTAYDGYMAYFSDRGPALDPRLLTDRWREAETTPARPRR